MLEILIISVAVLASLLLYFKYLKFRAYNRTGIERRDKWRKKGYGFIYFYTHRYIWRVFPVVKIGRATVAESRLKDQKTPSPFGLKVLAVVMVADELKAESYIHRRYRFERIYNDRRNEWFWITPRLWCFMQSVKDNKHTVRVRKIL